MLSSGHVIDPAGQVRQPLRMTSGDAAAVFSHGDRVVLVTTSDKGTNASVHWAK